MITDNNSKIWRFRDDMLNYYINQSSCKTFQDAEDRLNYLEKRIQELTEELEQLKRTSIHNDLPQSARMGYDSLCD